MGQPLRSISIDSLWPTLSLPNRRRMGPAATHTDHRVVSERARECMHFHEASPQISERAPKHSKALDLSFSILLCFLCALFFLYLCARALLAYGHCSGGRSFLSGCRAIALGSKARSRRLGSSLEMGQQLLLRIDPTRPTPRMRPDWDARPNQYKALGTMPATQKGRPTPSALSIALGRPDRFGPVADRWAPRACTLLPNCARH